MSQLLSNRDRRPTKRPDTIRVLNIPDDMSKQDLEREIDGVFDSPSKVHSLVRASRTGSCWRKHATVSFPSLSNEKLLELLGTSNKSLCGKTGLLYDKLFMAITPLHDAGEDAVVE